MFKSVGVGFLSRIISVLSNIIIIPIILKHLTPEQFSLWMLFVSFYSLVIIFDFGFSATISRYVSYVLSGATLQQLQNGFYENVWLGNGGGIDYKALDELSRINKIIFYYLILIASVFLLCIYLYYCNFVGINISKDDRIAWGLFSISILIQLASIRYNGFLHGSGNVAKIYRNTICSNFVFLLFFIFFIYLQWSLVGICIARLLSSLMIFILNAISSSKLTCVYPRLRCNEVKGHDNKRLFKRIRDKSFHLGIGGLGNFICNRMTIMVMTATVAIQNIAGVSFIINLSITILSISLILINNAMPELVRFRVEGAYDKLFNSFKRICFISIVFFISSYVVMVISTPYIIKITHSKVILPSNSIVLLCFCIFFIELIQSLSISFISTSNNTDFAKYQIITGLSFLLICFVFSYFKWTSLVNILLVQLIVQCIYNGWKWPFVILCEYNKVRHLIRKKNDVAAK